MPQCMTAIIKWGLRGAGLREIGRHLYGINAIHYGRRLGGNAVRIVGIIQKGEFKSVFIHHQRIKSAPVALIFEGAGL